ncbi:hypothetical protein HELRODRAFT_187684 [Helobdella robusta]|uniref:PX domain-containing protein n=1 Tax=Helobdella robusta TaxID=6412 RepID=T1FPB9_HELRO|nr:hypothetical protein HELRODRAFT_187684 [Helobdella robusta]ESO11356.1 hypothetical protein HELRODRAFT_187684 [Helobdella robusta]
MSAGLSVGVDTSSAADAGGVSDSTPTATSPPTNHDRKSLHLWLEITVNDPEKRNANMKESYVVYCIETRVIDSNMPKYGDAPTSCWRRYSEFELLRNYLISFYPNLIIPPLPYKKAPQFIGRSSIPLSLYNRTESDFIEKRRIGLEKFLMRIAKHKILSMDKIFFCFLFEDSAIWRDRLAACDCKSKTDFKALTSIMMAIKKKKGSSLNGNEQLHKEKIYSDNVISCINTLIKIRGRILNSENIVHRYHGDYGKVMIEWWAVEDGFGGLQAASHYLDAFSQNVEPFMDEEDVLMESLHDCLRYVHSLRKVCLREEMMLLNSEELEASLRNKESQKNLVQQQQQERQMEGVGVKNSLMKNMKERIFGCESNEEREAHLKCIEHDIHISKEMFHALQRDTKNACETATEDIRRFHAEKNSDISHILLRMAFVQIEKSKKNVTVWQNIKESFHKL